MGTLKKKKGHQKKKVAFLGEVKEANLTNGLCVVGQEAQGGEGGRTASLIITLYCPPPPGSVRVLTHLISFLGERNGGEVRGEEDTFDEHKNSA